MTRICSQDALSRNLGQTFFSSLHSDLIFFVPREAPWNVRVRVSVIVHCRLHRAPAVVQRGRRQRAVQLYKLI